MRTTGTFANAGAQRGAFIVAFVDKMNLDVLLFNWGDRDSCAADLNGDGVVDWGDVTVLFENWTGEGTCFGGCGGAGTHCKCDEFCCIAMDCCTDKHNECGGCNPASSCEGLCGDGTLDGCFCDEPCCQLYDCCSDKFQQCGGCEPLAR